MSNEKSPQKIFVRKEARSIYLSLEDWDWLHMEGKGHPTHVIRRMILAFKQKEGLDKDG